MAVALALTAPVAVTAAALFLRRGVRGQRSVRVLARLLNAAARRKRSARLFTALHARIYRRSGGRLLQWWFGAHVLIIETRGRRSGRVRRTPIIYARDGERFVVTPANAGVNQTPQWWLNLRATGEGAVWVDGSRRRVVAREAPPSERDRLMALLLEDGPAIAAYEAYTERRFPVVLLEPVGTS